MDGHDTYALLLHELRVGAIVHDIPAEDGRGQDGVNLFGVHIAQLPVQDEVVAHRAKGHGRLFAEENKGEDITVLLLDVSRHHPTSCAEVPPSNGARAKGN